MLRHLRAEGPTWAALFVCYGGFAALLASADAWWAYPLLAVVLAFHSSLQHEMLHGHPTPWPLVNEALVFAPLSLSYPYRRYRDLHLAHHTDATLTDPYDDPESWYLDPGAWARAPGWLRALLTVNNCALGRMLIGPGLGFVQFVRGDLRLIRAGRRDVIAAWALHALGAAPLIWLLAEAGVSPLGYALACYFGLSFINLRSFLEHRAEDRPSGRSAIVEDGGLFSLLFLNNNLHVVHHAHPNMAWSELPVFYRRHKERFLAMNGGYFLPSYWRVLTRYGLTPKEPVPHPNMKSLGR